jgi:hypothetical protein
VPSASEDVVYGIGRIDASGRIADRAVITALGWRGGDRLTLTADAGVVTVRRCTGGMITLPGRAYIAIPAALRCRCGLEPGDRVLLAAIQAGRSHAGTGSPAASPWLFPGGMPGQPITLSRLGERLRAIGVQAMPGRRAALIDLAAQLPAAVLADALNLSPGTAVRWMRQAGADWNRYAADIARSRDHQP